MDLTVSDEGYPSDLFLTSHSDPVGDGGEEGLPGVTSILENIDQTTLLQQGMFVNPT